MWGIGSDFDGVDAPVEGLEKAIQLLRLSSYLRALGFNENDISLIMGGNFRRILSFNNLVGYNKYYYQTPLRQAQ